jgi:hypothetical protein
MQVIIKQAIKNIPVTSVILGKDWDDPEGHRLHMFFCFNCQNPITQYKGFVYKITAGDLPSVVGIYTKCDNCGRVYNFHPEVV